MSIYAILLCIYTIIKTSISWKKCCDDPCIITIAKNNYNSNFKYIYHVDQLINTDFNIINILLNIFFP